METKVVLLHGFGQEEIMACMRAVRAQVKDPDAIAFATTTESNMKWKVEKLIEHVAQEHDFRRSSRIPGNAPPMA